MSNRSFLCDAEQEPLPAGEKRQVWQVSFIDDDGMPLFDNGGVTFDKKTAFSLFRSFPHDFTQEQIDIIRRQLPHWYEFFSDRL